MTSKEALKYLCEHCEKLSIRDGFIGCPYRNISNDYCEEFETIKKDLEILEILKKHFNNKSLIKSLISFYQDDNDYNKVKVWLDD